jgi:hypothetical protein
LVFVGRLPDIATDKPDTMNLLLKTGWTVFLLLVLHTGVYAQYVPEDTVRKDTTFLPPAPKAQTPLPSDGRPAFDTDNLVPGGNLALSFGNPYYIDVSPMLGYQVTKDLMLGLGATYIATGGTYYTFTYRNTYYGGRVLGRQRIMDNLFANAELDFLNVPYFVNTTSNDQLRKWLLSPLVGGSYVIPFGQRGGVQITLLYNLNYQQQYSPYPSALMYRMGFFL